MATHYGIRPNGNTRLLLSQFSGAAAAYSLRLLSGFTGGKVVGIRRSSDNSERDFTSREIDVGLLERWVNGQEVAPADYGNGAAAAYSLRYVSESYSGPVVRVRRDSDNSEQDFTPKEIESGSLESFCGSGDGLVTTWYDQSGDGNDATQTTASDQPKIVDSGVLVTENGKAALDFDGSGDGLDLGTNFIALQQEPNKWVFATFKDNGSNPGRIFGVSNGTSSRYTLRADISDGVQFVASDAYRPIGFTHITDQILVTGELSGSTQALYKNGILEDTDERGNTSTDANVANIGIYNNNSQPLNGVIQELIFYPTDQSSNRALIESNINSYYGIYTGPDGLVTTWYDQSGNGNDATQTTASAQPKIVSAGALVTENGKAALDFDKDRLEVFTGSDSPQPNTFFISGRIFSTNDSDTDFVDATLFDSDKRHLIDGDPSGNFRLFAGNSYSSGINYNQDSALIYTLFNTNNSEISINGNLKVGGNVGSDVFNKDFAIGFSTSSRALVGAIQEFIFYPSDQSVNREAIESNINNHYEIY